MCGLVGFAGNYTAKVKEAVKLMLFFDQIRGTDSTGLASLHPKGKTSIFKKAVNATDFLQFNGANTILGDLSSNAIIGHNRAATVGKVNSINAHPFEVGDIILAHNGTLRKQHLLPESRHFEVDSENIAYAIDRNGVEATLKQLCGAFALSYYDGKDNTVNLVRNSERPLFTATAKGYSAGANVLFWASESWMITVACHKAGVELVSPPKELPVGVLMSIDITPSNITNIEGLITTKEVEFYKDVVSTLPYVGKEANTAGVNFLQPYRFYLTRLLKSSAGRGGNSGISYTYEGNTTDNTKSVTLQTNVPVDLDYIYSAKCSGFSINNGRTVMQMGDYKRHEAKSAKKSSSGLVEKSH